MKTLPILSVLMVAAACSGPELRQAEVQPVVTPVALAAASITASDITARVSFLASDALRGRDTPSPGLEAAAAYIASEFQRLGLEPRGDNGSWFQRYPYTIRNLTGADTRLVAIANGQELRFPFGSEVFAWSGATQQTRGDAVFVGSSVADAPGSLTNRTPIVYVKGPINRAWRTAVLSARNAAGKAGAAGMIVVLDSSITAENIKTASTQYSTTTTVAPVVSTLFLRYDRARDLFQRAGQDLDALVARANAGTIAPVALAKTQVHVETPYVELAHRPPNVVAVLPGSDPELRNTYVVLSAHMDHIGVTRPNAQGDSINNGADDDASGTSAVIEIAEALAQLPNRPARSVMFLLVSGEEKGLLGSQYFADHPTVPLASMVANINIDMIARNAPDTVVAIGQEYSTLGPLAYDIVRQHPELGLTASKDIWPEERFFFRSDHYNFAKKDIPAIFFFSGVHEDYHRPSDHVEKIDADKAARIARLAYYLAHEVASRREAPQWTEQGLKEVRSLTR